MKSVMKWISTALLLIVLEVSTGLYAETNKGRIHEIELTFVDTPISQAFEMLSTLGDVSIVLKNGVSGKVTAQLYEKSIDGAIRTIAGAAGYAVEKLGDSYIVMDKEEVGRDALGDMTDVRSFKVQYIDPSKAALLLEKYLSRYGSISALAERKIIVVADRPSFIQRIERVLKEIDTEPRQILIEAEILEISLTDDETYGVDWSARAKNNSSYGTSGLSNIGSTGFFMEYLTNDLDVFLKALSENDRVRTLSTPKLLVLEDQDAEVIIGDRIGFKVTTTIDSVTTESIEFIESGVILRVKAAVDNSDRIMLSVHPEVSSSTINDGIPSVTTTEVTTQLIADNGQAVFIGGLIKNSKSENESGVPGLRSIPVVGALFSQSGERFAKTETIVVIRPYLVNGEQNSAAELALQRSRLLSEELKSDVETKAKNADLDNALYLPAEKEKQVDSESDEVKTVKVEQKPKKEKVEKSGGLGWLLTALTLVLLL